MDKDEILAQFRAALLDEITAKYSKQGIPQLNMPLQKPIVDQQGYTQNPPPYSYGSGMVGYQDQLGNGQQKIQLGTDKAKYHWDNGKHFVDVQGNLQGDASARYGLIF